MTKITLSVKAAKAVKAYGLLNCLKAYKMNCEGYGGAGVAIEGPISIRTTRQADAAINAGREYTTFTQGEDNLEACNRAFRMALDNNATR